MLVIPIESHVGPQVRGMIQLLESRNMSPGLINDLPVFGLIAYDNGEPVAAGFLRDIEGPYAMLDSYITNPNAPAKVRNRALNLITDKLIKVARLNDKVKLLAFTADLHTHWRSLEHGFTYLPHTFSAITLK